MPILDFKCCGQPVQVALDTVDMVVLQCKCGQQEILTTDYRWIEESADSTDIVKEEE